MELNIFLNEEIGRLKTKLNKIILSEEIQNDKTMLNKTKKVLNIVEQFKNREVDDKMIEIILKIQELVNETKEDG